jgi:hypothetical protein
MRPVRCLLVVLVSCAIGIACGYDYSSVEPPAPDGGSGSPSNAANPAAAGDAGPISAGGIPHPGGADAGAPSSPDGGCNCDDGNPCTIDSCNAGVCTHLPAGRISCTTAQGAPGCCSGSFCCAGALCC